ncbi:PPIC-type PPIASE domain-containing protein [Paenibacillus tianmuensis]|uniref:peptidylprolyl isomerase n=1 Tax=Paenibacillus tianmuensis TaxID=624147 RepID=A0A1G4TX80_9BACL|nr:peptidylprolyl isomerase [Paenibacillus tianmuensis]SCW86013.1 PPIC-type PPIASE domain-containing protein [Paenibacillus tianmuensis]
MKKRMPLVIVLLVALFVLLFFLFRQPSRPDSYAEVLTINGEPVVMGEFEMVLKDRVAEVYGYFHETYGAQDRTEFWTTSFNGEIPLEMAKKKTLEKLKIIKTEQLLAKQYGLTDDVSYRSFKERLTEENRSRAEAMKKGQPVFGPREYSEIAYFNHVHDKIKRQLLDYVANHEAQAANEALHATYENMRRKGELKKPDRIRTQVVELAFGSGDGPGSLTRNAAMETMNGNRSGLASSKEADAVVRQLRVNASVKERIFDESTYASDSSEEEEKVFAAAQKLKPGEVSDVFETAGSVFVLQCTERTPGGDLRFEDVQDRLKWKYAEEQLKQRITETAENANIVIHHNVYDAITVR